MAQNKVGAKKKGPAHTAKTKRPPLDLMGVALNRAKRQPNPWSPGVAPQQPSKEWGTGRKQFNPTGAHSSGKTRLNKVGVRKKILKKVEKR